MMSLKQVIIIFSVLLLTGSCIKEEFDSSSIDQGLGIDGAFGIPVGYAELSLMDILPDTIEVIQTDDQGFITLRYGEEVFSADAGEFFLLQDVQTSPGITNNKGFPIDLALFPGGYSFSDTLWLDMPMPAPGARLDSILLKSGILDINLNSTAGLTGTVELEIPNLLNAGTPYANVLALPSTGNRTNLGGYVIAPDSTGQGTNILQVILEVELDPSTEVIAPGAEILAANISLSSLAYSSVFGYLGPLSTFTNQASFDIDLYDLFNRGTFHFERPELNLFTTSSFGLPLGLYPDVFYAGLPSGGSADIEGDEIPDQEDPFVPAYPGLQEVGSSAKDSLFINPNNTNVQAVLENNPDRFVYSFGGILNPSGYARNFITDTSRFSVFLELKLPLYGYADLILIEDTVAFELESILPDRPEEIEAIEFRLKTINSFPLNLHLQIYFSDGSNILDSLFVDRNIVTAAMDLDQDGKADPLENDIIKIPFDKDRVDGISDTEQVLFNARINTRNFESVPPENVRFFEDYFLDINMGAIVIVEAEL